MFLEKRLADSLDGAPDRGEINGNLVRKAIPGHGGRADRIPGGGHRVVAGGVMTIRFAAHDER